MTLILWRIIVMSQTDTQNNRPRQLCEEQTEGPAEHTNTKDFPSGTFTVTATSGCKTSNSIWSSAITWSWQPSTWGQKEARKTPGDRGESCHTTARPREGGSCRACSLQLTWLQLPSFHRHLHKKRRVHWLIKMDDKNISAQAWYKSSQRHLVLGWKRRKKKKTKKNSSSFRAMNNSNHRIFRV